MTDEIPNEQTATLNHSTHEGAVEKMNHNPTGTLTSTAKLGAKRRRKPKHPMIYAVHFQSTNDDWGTPQKLFDELDAEFQFTLDPCCFPDTAKCKKFYTKIDNGLAQSWADERVFMNPPYGLDIREWVAKAHESSMTDNALVVAVLPVRTDTRWWHDHVIGAGAEIRFVKGRIKFVRGDSRNSAPFPSAIVIYRPRSENV